ncbi:MAG: hypothetical protein KGI90_00320 [Burkholderiales bacterium]|nr:hypothetical protein [Burkholderiales bacterium]
MQVHQGRYLRILTSSALAASLSLLAGCSMMPGSKSDRGTAAPAAAPAATPSAPKIGPGMNAAGEVIDSKKVESGYGRHVKGLDDWEGEITGKPAPGSKFTQLQIGMSAAKAMKLLGQPDDQGSYITGKAFIPFFFGSDRYRYELVYKGQGRLIFAGASGFDGSQHLIWIIHSANEGDTR